MKIFYALVLCLISIRSFALDVDAIVSSVNQLTEKSCSTDAAPDKNLPIQIGYLRGSPADIINDEQAGEDYLAISKSLLEGKGFKVITKSVHHLNYQALCEKFKETPDSRIILVGHSYGASGALQAAKCLNEAKIKTELFIAVSSFDFLKTISATDIPDYIENDVNFSVPNSLISGYKEHTAIDPAKTRVLNIESTINGLGSSHLYAPRRLMPLLGLITAAKIEGKSDALQISGKLSSDQVNKQLSQFWNCDAPAEKVSAVVPASDEPDDNGEE